MINSLYINQRVAEGLAINLMLFLVVFVYKKIKATNKRLLFILFGKNIINQFKVGIID